VLAGDELAELVGDGGGGQAREDVANRAVEVEQEVSGAGDDGVELGGRAGGHMGYSWLMVVHMASNQARACSIQGRSVG